MRLILGLMLALALYGAVRAAHEERVGASAQAGAIGGPDADALAQRAEH